MHNIFLAVVAFSSALAFNAYSYAADSPVSGASEKLIRAEFDRQKPGRGLLVEQRAGRSVAEVCFDHCDYFEWSGGIHEDSVWDFIVLFESSVGFASNVDSYKLASSEMVRTILARNPNACSSSAESSRFTCKWPQLAKTRSVKVGIANYDEGQRCFAWRDLATMAWPKASKCSPITSSPWKR
jgi:hypothetical protein